MPPPVRLTNCGYTVASTSCSVLWSLSRPRSTPVIVTSYRRVAPVLDAIGTAFATVPRLRTSSPSIVTCTFMSILLAVRPKPSIAHRRSVRVSTLPV